VEEIITVKLNREDIDNAITSMLKEKGYVVERINYHTDKSIIGSSITVKGAVAIVMKDECKNVYSVEMEHKK
jgi:hypothetical protein